MNLNTEEEARMQYTKESGIIIVGAGLCGTLLAIRMAQRGHNVRLYEQRSDMRKSQVDAGRSINLAISDRGFKALRLVGLEDDVRKQVIPMYGRMIHSESGETWLSRYSGRVHEYINSVSRPGLNMALLDAAEAMPNLNIFFNHKCFGVDLEAAKAAFLNAETGEKVTAKGKVVIGTDGAGSMVRRSIFAHSARLRFDYSQDFLDHGYKELSIPASETGGWRIEKNALHIWPRQSFMLIALPNLDGSFTVTLFLPFDAKPGFNQLKSEEEVRTFFSQQFPSALEHMPELEKVFFNNPTGILGTIRCYPWHVDGKVLVMGDAAHAIVPFYGQGMNAAMEDVTILDGIMDSHEGDWSTIFREYQSIRKKDTDAIADLALENYYEMRDHVDNSDFILKRKIEMTLEKQHPDYSSKYNLVTFNEDVPYSVAKDKGHAQDDLLLAFCKDKREITDADINEAYSQLKAISAHFADSA